MKNVDVQMDNGGLRGIFMKQVWKHEMTGYREPTTWESERIQQYFSRHNRFYYRVFNACNVISTVLAACFILCICDSLPDVMTNENILYGIMALLSVCGVYIFRKQKRKSKLFSVALERHAFVVMDCKAYEADPSVDVINSGAVKIYNQSGQYCKEWLLVDRESSEKCKTNEEVSFLLMRCDYVKEDAYFELFTKRKLGGEN